MLKAFRYRLFRPRKAEEDGSKVVLVNSNNTTQVFSRCGLTVKKSLSERMHSCPCGLFIDRDLSA